MQIKDKDIRTHTEHAYAREVSPFPEPVWDWPMKPLIEAFPEYLGPLIESGRAAQMMGFIEAAVKPGDEEAWANTIEIYRMNFDPELSRYLPDKTATLLSVFKNCKKELVNGGRSDGAGNSRSSNSGAAERKERVDEIIRDSNERFERPEF